MRIVESRKIRFEGEEGNEESLFILRAHPITNVGWILTSIFAIIVPVVVLIVLFTAAKVSTYVGIITVIVFILTWFLIVFGIAFQQYLRWFFNIYILTNKRVVDIDFFGLFHRKVSQTTLGNVQDVTYSKAGILQNFFDFGDLHLQTAAAAAHFEFLNIPDPEGNQKQILNLVAKYRRVTNHNHGTGTAGPDSK